MGGWSLGINAKSSNIGDSFEFLRWASTNENANYLTLLGGQPAITSVFTNDELVNLYPWLPLYYAAYKYTQPVVPPYMKGKPIISQDKIDSILCKHASGLIDEQVSVSDALQATQAELEELFCSCFK